MKIFVSTALSTGLWAPSGHYREVLSPREEGSLAFSSVELSGAASSASVLDLRERPDLKEDLQRLLDRLDGISIKVVGIQVYERDIDGCTAVAELDLTAEAASWEVVASIADEVVRWSGPLAELLQRERLAARFGTPADLGGRATSTTVTAPRAEALWSHTVVVCDTAVVEAHHSCQGTDAERLLPSSFEIVAGREVMAYLALHGSLLCASDEEDARRVVELMDELHGWWTASWLLDQQLLDTATSMARTLSRAELPELSASADALADVTAGVGILRSRLDTFRLGLGGLAWPIWEAAARRWALEDNLVSLERKRQVLVDMTTSFREAMDAHQSTRLNQLAAFFAIVSSLASFVAVVLFLFPWLQEPDGFTLRIVLVVLALTASLAGLVWSSRFMLRVARRARLRG